MSRPELYVVNEVAVVETGPDEADVLSVPEQGPPGVPGATGNAGPNLIADTTALGLLTHIADPAFLLVGNAAGDRARKLTPTGWGLSNLLANVPAGRVPFADAVGAVTSNAGLTFNSGTGVLSAGGLTATGNLTSTAAGSIASPSIGWDVSGGRHGWYLFGSGTPTTAFVGAVANGNLHTATRANSTTFTNGVNLGWATGADPTVGQTVGLVPGGTNTLRVTNGSTGVGNLIIGNLSARGGNIDLSPASTGGVGLNGSSISSLIFNANGTNPRMGLINGSDLVLASGCRFGWGNASTVASNSSPDAELTRISAGFVGLGSPTNKVSIGHDGTNSNISSPLGPLWLRAGQASGVTLFSRASDGTGLNASVFAVMASTPAVRLRADVPISWSASAGDTLGTADLRVRRSSANTVDFDTGTDGSFADVRLRNLTLSGRLGFATSDTAPANTTTPLLWMNVLVGGITYKMPLYQ